MSAPRKARVTWIGVIVGLLGFSVITQAVLIVASLSDPSFAVERDYEAKAANWTATQQQAAVNAKLDWTLNLLTAPTASPRELQLTVHLFDQWGKPITEASITGSGFHNARANDIVDFTMTYVDGARYVATIPARRSGKWEFRFAVDHESDHFTETVLSMVRVNR